MSLSRLPVLRRFGFTLIELLAVIVIAGVLTAGGYPKLTEYLWGVKLEQQARMIYQELQLFIEATVTAGPGEGPIPRRGTAVFENGFYEEYGRRIRRYSLKDPLDRLAGIAKGNRDLTKDEFCIIATDARRQGIDKDVIEMKVNSNGRIIAPTETLYLEIKSFDPETGETDDSDSWHIVIDPMENRIRLRHARQAML